MTTSISRRVLGVLFVALVATLGVTSSAVAGSEEVREIRDVVPFGKDDERFGRITDLPPDLKTPPSTPLQARLRASKAPALNEPMTITLQTYAAEPAPGTRVGIRLPDGAEVLEGSTEELVDLEAGQTHELTIVATLTKLGEQTIKGNASRRVSEGETWGDDDALFLTVEADGGFVGHRSGDDAELEAIRVSDELSGEPQQLPVKNPRQPLAAECCPQEPDPGEPVDIDVCFVLENRNPNWPATPFRDARVQFLDVDTGINAPDVLASGYLGYHTGCASVTVWNGDMDAGGVIDVSVRVRMEHTGRYRIRNQAGNVFTCSTATQVDVSANLNLGTQQCGGSTGNGRAAWIYNDVYRLRRFVEETRAGKGDPPGSCTVQWQTSSTTGTFYRLSDMLVHLRDDDLDGDGSVDADSRDLIVHECAHRYMHVAYGGWPAPATTCPALHQINRAIPPACAWTEGYTYVLVAGAGGDPSYVDGSLSFDLEVPDCQTSSTTFDAGPAVEGRVGGVLIDLLDLFPLSFHQVFGFANEPFIADLLKGCWGVDDESGRFSDFWQLFTAQNDDVLVVQGSLTDSFSRAWQAAGHTAGPGSVYRFGGKYYFCGPGGNCVGALNTIPTFAID
jgi:hypothetical protein